MGTSKFRRPLAWRFASAPQQCGTFPATLLWASVSIGCNRGLRICTSYTVDITTVCRGVGFNSAKAMTRPAIATTLTTVANKTVGRTLMRSSPVCRYSTGGRAYFSSSASNCFSALATAVPHRSLSEKNLSLSPLAKIVIPPVATAAPP